tara:strand:+ start:1160 stop:1774 length:615 start_codon:yes stop_codon:yes gene_type:complete
MSIVTLNNRGVRSVTTFGSVSGGSMVFIKKLTASSDSNLTFLNGSSDVVFDSTYKEYLFTLKNTHPSANPGIISFQATTDGTNYNTTVTNTYFRAYHNEAGNSAALQYATGFDHAQSTSVINLDSGSGSGNHEASSGLLRIFNPSSTTFVKHFMGQVSDENDGDFNHNVFTAGYFNTTSAITGIRFSMDSGNIDAGDICLYGIN